MKKMKLVLVGNGMAGVRAVEELIKLAPDLYDITVFGAEPHPNYNRILLSPVLAGEQTVDADHPELVGVVRGERHHAARRQDGDRGRPREARRARRGGRRQRDRGRVRPPAAVHRLQPVHPAGAGQGPERRDRLPRHRRHQHDDRDREDAQARGRHRRRPARPRSGQRPDAARHERDRGARQRVADGAPARRRGGRPAAQVAGRPRPATSC